MCDITTFQGVNIYGTYKFWRWYPFELRDGRIARFPCYRVSAFRESDHSLIGHYLMASPERALAILVCIDVELSFYPYFSPSYGYLFLKYEGFN